MRLFASLVVVLLSACSTISSSARFTEGTQALERGDYETAATLLEEAVELDPSLSRNHNNLASALYELGRIEEGWPHSRAAVMLDPKNEAARANNLRHFKALSDEHDIDVGTSRSDVARSLGEPDSEGAGSECTWLQYGYAALCIVDEKVARISVMNYE